MEGPVFWRYMWAALALAACFLIGWSIRSATHPAQVPCQVGCGLTDRPE